MTADAILSALDLPPQARVSVRIPKKTLAENAANTPADRTAITDGVDELHWVASLKPATAGVPAFRDDAREYLEIAVLTAAWKPGAKAARLRELIHRAIPYPLLLLAADGTVSATHIRRSEATAAATVLDGPVHTADLKPDDPASAAFLASLPLAGLPAADLFVLYQAYIDRTTALAVARVTGAFAVASAPVAVRRREALARLADAEAAIARTRKAAETATQMNKRVELNLELRKLTADRDALLAALRTEIAQ